MPQGIKWDYQVYCLCDDYMPGHSNERTYLVGRQKSGLLWLGRSEDGCYPPIYKVVESYSYSDVGSFINALPECEEEDFLRFFRDDPKVTEEDLKGV